MVKKEACEKSQINIGLLEFRPTKENFENIGKMVWEILNRPEQQREKTYFLGKEKFILQCQEVVIHGT